MDASHENAKVSGPRPASRIFLLIFFTIWLGIFLFAVIIGMGTILKQAGQGIPWPVAIPLLLFLSLFVVVPAVVVVAAWRKSRRQIAQGDSQEPWNRRSDWSTGHIESVSQIGPAAALLAFALIWNSIVVAIIYVIFFHESTPARPPDPVLYPVLGIFAVVGIGLAAAGLGQLARWKRFGKSILELETRPGEIGGRFAGRIWAPMRPAPSTEIEVALKCIERKTRHTNKRRETVEKVLWQESRRLRADQTDLAPQGGIWIPVEFVIPPECAPTTALGSEDGIYWRLDAHAKMAGPDYAAQFVVPVFVTEKSFSPESSLLQEKARRQRLREGPPRRLSVRISPTMTGGTEIYWPPNRRPLATLIFFLLAGALGAGAWLAATKAGIMPGAIVGLFAAVFGMAAWGAALSWSRLELEPDGRIRITQKMIRRKSTECSARHIQTVARSAGGQVGQTPFFHLSLRLTDGREFKLGSGMESEDETAYLEALIEDWLEHQRRRHSAHGDRM